MTSAQQAISMAMGEKWPALIRAAAEEARRSLESVQQDEGDLSVKLPVGKESIELIRYIATVKVFQQRSSLHTLAYLVAA